MKRTLVIEGKKIDDISSFYEEINRVFMHGEDWKLGESLDGFNDLLYGGYGTITNDKLIELVWSDIDHSAKALGRKCTIQYYEAKLQNPTTYNISWVKEKLLELESGKGQTYFDIILEIINDHPNIELIKN